VDFVEDEFLGGEVRFGHVCSRIWNIIMRGLGVLSQHADTGV
jgi:hypothetical protein